MSLVGGRQAREQVDVGIDTTLGGGLESPRFCSGS